MSDKGYVRFTDSEIIFEDGTSSKDEPEYSAEEILDALDNAPPVTVTAVFVGDTGPLAEWFAMLHLARQIGWGWWMFRDWPKPGLN